MVDMERALHIDHQQPVDVDWQTQICRRNVRVDYRQYALQWRQCAPPPPGPISFSLIKFFNWS